MVVDVVGSVVVVDVVDVVVVVVVVVGLVVVVVVVLGVVDVLVVELVVVEVDAPGLSGCVYCAAANRSQSTPGSLPSVPAFLYRLLALNW